MSRLGVHGCGKSTLIEGIRRAHRDVRATFIGMSDYEHVERLARLRATVADGVDEWRAGAFGQLRHFATAMYFMRFYDEQVLPALDEYDVLYVDRYFPRASRRGWHCASRPS